ncbi:hypothetical protein MKZ38_007340 [Zalerion maritima]|uniref:WW domain-containing protein n=1 Tax=Zalerion maritima TaxID=339359 RepID=A0AAD5WTP4_9PEZI|nr:hypothetical protein MKZ38_007340 [Zalerion maritima]
MMARPRGFNDAELFLDKPAEDCDSPTVEPLRIFKPQSPQPGRQHQYQKRSGDRFQYPAPPGASSSPAPSTSSSSYPKPPTFPLPPGASSSANPLPYPQDDEDRASSSRPHQQQRPPYPADEDSNSNGSNHRRTSASSAKPYSTPAPPAPKPYTSPPPQLPSFNDTSPRLNTSPTEKRPGLAERRGTAPLPLSPVSPEKEKEDGLFAKPLRDPNQQAGAAGASSSSAAGGSSYPSYAKKTYYPPPGGASNNAPGRDDMDTLKMPVENTVNRFASTASNSTTRASRGSPPPPETPVAEPGSVPGGGIEARYAAAGISGTATLNSFSAAATQRLAQYGGAPPQAQSPRPWTPTESPDQQPHGPPTVYQGNDVVSTPQRPSAAGNASSSNPQLGSEDGSNLQVSILEQDFQRMGAKTPPPAYSSVNPGGGSSYPNEKQRPVSTASPAQPSSSAAAVPSSSSSTPAPVGNAGPLPQKQQPPIHPAAAAGLASPGLPPTGHPAFANEQQSQQQPQQQQLAVPPQQPQPQQQQQQQQHPTLAGEHPAFANEPSPEKNGIAGTGMSHTPSVFQGGAGPSSPPPLPEGWIAHLDQNSGQYYYIHVATSSTQWEFPKGPNPIHHEAAPLSPTASTYGNPLGSPMFGGGKQSMASPMFPPTTPGYAESIMSVAASAAPSTAGFTGPPPTAGVDIFKITPTNGVYFGPYLRYVNMDVERGVWMGSIMIVTDAPQPPTIHIHLSNNLSPNPSQLVPNSIYTHQRWTFYKYSVELPMTETTERWTYAVTSHLGCTRYEFVIAGRQEHGWRFIAHSGNDFAATTNQNERAKLGGIGFMWKDVLQKNIECGGFHVQLGLGDQIYGDRLWKEVPLLKQWLSTSGKDNRKNTNWTARHEEDVSHAYFHYYTSHFDQPFLREAFAQIPHILQIDDHDIFDGYGSFPDYMQNSQIFKNIGRVATDMYLLFQHHTTPEILRNVNSDQDLFTVTGTGYHFVKYLGPDVVIVGPDCRSERSQSHVMAGPTYQGIFPKVAMLPPSVQHCIWMVSVPLIYPRLETVEQLANTITTGKKAVNTTYNLLGKVSSSVAGVVGGKEVVQHGFSHVKKAVGKSGLMGTVFNQFGDIDIADALKDMWTHDSKDLERTYLVRTLQTIAQQKGLRMTFLSGDVNCSGAGLVHDPSHPSDHKTMYQLISSPIVAAPAANYLMKMLHNNNKVLYLPQNGSKTTNEVSDTKEDMMEIFHTDASGAQREHKKLINRRNYVTGVAFDPTQVQQPNGLGINQGQPPQPQQQQQGLTKLNLAFDFVVQGDGAFTTPTKYGPVIVEHLEYGR